MRKSDGISLALFLASFPSLALATSQACLTVCLGLQSTQFLTYDRLTGTPVTVNYVWPAPAWFQGGWVENHLAPACDAWRVGVTVPGVDYDAFDTTPNVIVIFETAGWVYPGALAVTEPSGPAYGWTAQKNIHVDTFEHEALDWFTGGGTPPGGIDLQTVLIHEIGHALGLGGDVSSVFSQCTVMTGTYLGANRATKGLDQAAINCYYGPVPVGDIQNFSVQGSSHNVNLSFEIQGGANPNEYAAVYVSDNPMGPARLIDLLTDHAVVMPDSNDWVDSYRLAPAGSYVYWLDYNAYPGVNVLRPPDGLYPATGWGTVTGPAQPTIDPPDIYLASDAPYDLGGSIELFFY